MMEFEIIIYIMEFGPGFLHFECLSGYCDFFLTFEIFVDFIGAYWEYSPPPSRRHFKKLLKRKRKKWNCTQKLSWTVIGGRRIQQNHFATIFVGKAAARGEEHLKTSRVDVGYRMPNENIAPPAGRRSCHLSIRVTKTWSFKTKLDQTKYWKPIWCSGAVGRGRG